MDSMASSALMASLAFPCLLASTALKTPSSMSGNMSFNCDTPTGACAPSPLKLKRHAWTLASARTKAGAPSGGR